ncbi:MAG: tetratricopeptide repeat protein [Pseudoxanthomonas sp.]
MIVWVLVAALALPVPVAVPETAPPTRGQVVAVPPQLQVQLQEEVIAPAHGDLDRLRRLVWFMGDGERGLGLQYREDATYTVAEAYLNRQANCVTYTLMFLALAHLAGLEAYPQEIEETLSWQQLDDIVYRSNHVNVRVRVGMQRYLVDVGGDFVVGRHPAKPISMQRALAQYYNNRAVTLLSEQRLPAALAHADIALGLDPDYPTTWSNTGVLRLRSGDRSGAERAYATALSLDPENASALFNMVGLYQRNGDRMREASFRKRLDKVERRDPFHQFLLAMEYEKQGDGGRAAKHYLRAIQLHGDEHRFYSGLARAYLLDGDPRRARRALERALALARDEASRASYQARLAQLSASP